MNDTPSPHATASSASLPGALAASPAAAVPAQQFREGMALLAGAVNVVTTDGPAGRAGLTASAVCSVTDQPPTLLVCVNRSSFAHQFFMGNGVLCVNVLSAEQQEVSALFASRGTTMEERFASVGHETLSSGAPVLHGALVSFDGTIVQSHQMGTHDIFLVELQAVRVATDRGTGALAYFNRAYHRVGAEAQACSTPLRAGAGAATNPAADAS